MAKCRDRNYRPSMRMTSGGSPGGHVPRPRRGVAVAVLVGRCRGADQDRVIELAPGETLVVRETLSP
jgi:hypothetical protein